MCVMIDVIDEAIRIVVDVASDIGAEIDVQRTNNSAHIKVMAQNKEISMTLVEGIGMVSMYGTDAKGIVHSGVGFSHDCQWHGLLANWAADKIQPISYENAA